jgi:hypothetical protein
MSILARAASFLITANKIDATEELWALGIYKFPPRNNRHRAASEIALLGMSAVGKADIEVAVK